jgi:hypothetical protein
MVQATIDNFRDIQQAIFDDLSLHLSKVNDPQLNTKLAKDAVETLLQQLKTAINEQNSGKAKEIMEMKDMMAMW